MQLILNWYILRFYNDKWILIQVVIKLKCWKGGWLFLTFFDIGS
jgi:hypothetical protein